MGVVPGLSKRLQLVTGKGGVGKSSLVAALALRAARRGQRPLVVELGHRATMQSVFDVPRIGFEAVDVGHGVCALNIELESAIREYVVRYVRIPRLVDKVLGNAALRRFFDAAPGVAETVTLAKLRTLFAERHRGFDRWDPILVDLDATGHALMLLELPRVLSELLGKGPLRRTMESITELFCDDRYTALHLVAAPQPLVVQETRELYDKLHRDHRIPFGVLFVNQMPPEPLDARMRGDLGSAKRFAEAYGLPRLSEDILIAEGAIERFRRSRAAQLELENAVRLTQVVLPEVFEATAPLNVVAMLSSLLPEDSC